MSSRMQAMDVRVVISMMVITMVKEARDKITAPLTIGIITINRLTSMDVEARLISVMTEVITVRPGTDRSRVVRGVETGTMDGVEADEVDADEDADISPDGVVRAKKSSEQRSAQWTSR